MGFGNAQVSASRKFGVASAPIRTCTLSFRERDRCGVLSCVFVSYVDHLSQRHRDRETETRGRRIKGRAREPSRGGPCAQGLSTSASPEGRQAFTSLGVVGPRQGKFPRPMSPSMFGAEKGREDKQDLNRPGFGESTKTVGNTIEFFLRLNCA